MDRKKCSKCGQFKAYMEFYKRKESKDGFNGRCIECIKLSKRKYYKENTEKVKESVKVYTENHKNKIKQYQKQYHMKYYLQNKEQLKQRCNQYYQENFEHIKIRHLNYYKENIERIKQYHKKFFKTEKRKESCYISSLKRRSFKHKVSFTIVERKQILDRDNWTCQCCGIRVHDKRKENWNTPDKAHIDHIIPLSKGGNSDTENLQVLCRTCNLTKKDKIEKTVFI